ncbi:hypothetical protein [Pedobacter jejuensis]|uniref:Uncharacterized protein n=1 Tax=Pedobacter jejuensis TaxID=1268550 RepID=A0A3N0BTK2_9SPHI|nr:hypothetical protein [Pedobacter jejuensis]RNL52427.1 hypothetical protein D7004_12770 [Pedobacter jejuensis]
MKEVNQYSSVNDLDNIREGDIIKHRNGKTAIVVKIQIVCAKGQKQYFYKLKNEGTIFIAKSSIA